LAGILTVIMRLTDILMAFPYILLALNLVGEPAAVGFGPAVSG
jgi:ABC-type dipeptide/oligopeptide/nickel transport system permease subunit